MKLILPRLYAIVDAGVLVAKGMSVEAMAAELAGAGVGLVQYRDKRGGPQEALAGAAKLRAGMGAECLLVMNDRVDLALLAGFGGVHVGQGDLSPEDARRVIGARGVVGVSTHTEDQVRVAEGGGRGLCGHWAGVCHGNEGGCGGGGWAGWGEAGSGYDGEAAGGDWRDYAGELLECNRGWGGFRGGDLWVVCGGTDGGGGGAGLYGGSGIA